MRAGEAGEALRADLAREHERVQYGMAFCVMDIGQVLLVGALGSLVRKVRRRRIAKC